jgi:hypothetical protein
MDVTETSLTAEIEFERKTVVTIDVSGFLAEWKKEWEEWLAEADPEDGESPDDPEVIREFVGEVMAENGDDIFYEAGMHRSWVETLTHDESSWVTMERRK